MQTDAPAVRRASGAGPRAAEALWWGNGAGPTLARTLLLPAEWLYRCITAVRNGLFSAGIRPAHRAGIPVVSVGNLTVGGAGKTPVARFLAERFAARGGTPAILHRGYGSGDEPALHRLWNPAIPVYTGADRITAASAAARAGATVAILDDAFQHRSIARDLDIVLVPAEDWTDRPRLLPRGPWREPVSSLRRADLVLVTRKTATADRAQRVARHIGVAFDIPVAVVALSPAGWRHADAMHAAPSGPALAVVALARPGPFLHNAAAAGADVAEAIVFRDHHRFSPGDARTILATAGSRPIVTSEKEAVKLLQLLPPTQVWILLQRVRIEEGETVIDSALDRFA
jgi:tetraacyldisaccharide 4'-kinase